jgi:hypothetical protein
VKEISRLYVANLQRDIVQLIEFLNENPNQPVGKSKNSRATSADLLRMKETLDAINVKPEKGRRKDLRRIEQAVRSLRKMTLTDKKDA